MKRLGPNLVPKTFEGFPEEMATLLGRPLAFIGPAWRPALLAFRA